MDAKVEVLIIKPKNVYKAILDDDYRQFKEELEFDSPLDCIERKIGNEYYDIWVDDEGLFKEEQDGTVRSIGICQNAKEILAGNIMIARHDDEGNVVSLTDEDFDNILKHIGVFNQGVIINYDTNVGFLKMKFDKGDYVLQYEA